MYEIRILEYEDLPALADLYSHYALHTITTYCSTQVSVPYMNGLLRGVGHHAFVATKKGDAVVGYIHLTPTLSFRGKRFELAIYILPQYTRQGLGTRLVRYGEEYARRIGAKTLSVSVCTENAPSLALFDSLGYSRTKVKVDAGYKFGRRLDTQLFEKRLDETGGSNTFS